MLRLPPLGLKRSRCRAPEGSERTAQQCLGQPHAGELATTSTAASHGTTLSMQKKASVIAGLMCAPQNHPPRRIDQRGSGEPHGRTDDTTRVKASDRARWTDDFRDGNVVATAATSIKVPRRTLR